MSFLSAINHNTAANSRAFFPVFDFIGLPLAAIAVRMLAAGSRDRTGFQYTVANSTFLMLCAVGGGSCNGVGDPVTGGMSCLSAINHNAAANNGAFLPVMGLI